MRNVGVPRTKKARPCGTRFFRKGARLHQAEHLPNRNACEATNHVDDHVSVVERHGVFVLAHLTVLNTKQRDELVVGELEVPNRGGAEADEQGDVLADAASCGDGTKSSQENNLRCGRGNNNQTDEVRKDADSCNVNVGVGNDRSGNRSHDASDPTSNAELSQQGSQGQDAADEDCGVPRNVAGEILGVDQTDDSHDGENADRDDRSAQADLATEDPAKNGDEDQDAGEEQG